MQQQESWHQVHHWQAEAFSLSLSLEDELEGFCDVSPIMEAAADDDDAGFVLLPGTLKRWECCGAGVGVVAGC